MYGHARLKNGVCPNVGILHCNAINDGLIWCA